jgi:hypothetical protein
MRRPTTSEEDLDRQWEGEEWSLSAERAAELEEESDSMNDSEPNQSSTELLSELEAARMHALIACKIALQAGDDCAKYSAGMAVQYLTNVIDTQQRHSANVTVSDGANHEKP